MKRYLIETLQGLLIGMALLGFMFIHPPLNFISAHASIALYFMLYILLLYQSKRGYDSGRLDTITYTQLIFILPFICLLMAFISVGVQPPLRYLNQLAADSIFTYYANITIWTIIIAVFFVQILACLIRIFQKSK